MIVLLVVFGVYKALQPPPPKPVPPAPPQSANSVLPSGPAVPDSGQQIEVASGGGETGQEGSPPALTNPAPTPAPAQENRQQAPVQPMLQKARAAFAAGRLIEPVDDNAVHYARLVRQADPNNAPAAQLMQLSFKAEYQIIRNLATQGKAGEAARQLTIMMQYFPNEPSLVQLQSSINQAANPAPPQEVLAPVQTPAQTPFQAPVQQPVAPPVAQAPANVNFVTPAYHRHRLGNKIGYCEGFLTITPSGGVNYTCRVAHDATGCHNFNAQLSDLKNVNVFTNGNFAVLHLEKGRLSNWDFYTPVNVFAGLNAAVNAARGAR